jgi:hypothetical protein
MTERCQEVKTVLGGRETRYRAREEVQVALPGQSIDPAVDPFENICTLVAVKEIVDEEPDFALGHHA